MNRKTFDLIETKADGESGTFTALASVFGNIDHVGDRVMPGAFAKTLERWRSSGDPIPVVLSHQWDNPMAHIGIADPRAVVETDRGLLVQGSLDISDNNTAKQVHKLMKRRSLKSFSFGYTVPEGGEQLADDGANELTEVDLVEFGPTLKGANPEAELQAVKSALDKEEPAGGPVEVTNNTMMTGSQTASSGTGGVTVKHGDLTSEVTATVKEAEPELPEVAEADEQSTEPPLTGEALEKAIEESDRFQAMIATRVEERLKAEREAEEAEKPPEPKNLPAPVETAESEKPAEPAKPAAKDDLKNQNDLLRLEAIAGRPLRR